EAAVRRIAEVDEGVVTEPPEGMPAHDDDDRQRGVEQVRCAEWLLARSRSRWGHGGCPVMDRGHRSPAIREPSRWSAPTGVRDIPACWRARGAPPPPDPLRRRPRRAGS